MKNVFVFLCVGVLLGCHSESKVEKSETTTSASVVETATPVPAASEASVSHPASSATAVPTTTDKK